MSLNHVVIAAMFYYWYKRDSAPLSEKRMMLPSKSTNECLRQSPLLQGPFSKHLLNCRTSLVRKCQGQIMGFAELRLLGKSCLLQDLRDPICLHVLRLACFIFLNISVALAQGFWAGKWCRAEQNKHFTSPIPAHSKTIYNPTAGD